MAYEIEKTLYLMSIAGTDGTAVLNAHAGIAEHEKERTA